MNFRIIKLLPSEGAWNKLSKKLFVREFFKFNVTRFNVFYLAVILSLVTAGFVFMNSYGDNGIANFNGLKSSTSSENVGQNKNSRNSIETKNSIEKDGTLQSKGNNKNKKPNNGVVLDDGENRKLDESSNEE